MSGFRMLRIVRVGVAFLLLLLSVSHVYAQSVNVVSLQEMRPDKACGPRCLWVLMQITKAGQPECGIKCICELIGKEVFAATSLMDLKNAARQLGFSAEGYKLTSGGLARTKGCAILPVGTAEGTVDATGNWESMVLKIRARDQRTVQTLRLQSNLRL